MQAITVEEAQTHLAEILAQLTPGDEIVLTRDDKPIATVRGITPFFPQSPDAAAGAPGDLALRTMPVAQAQSQLLEVVHDLAPGAEIVLTGNRKLIATIRPPLPAPRQPRRLGTLKGTVLYVAPDFDENLFHYSLRQWFPRDQWSIFPGFFIYTHDPVYAAGQLWNRF